MPSHLFHNAVPALAATVAIALALLSGVACQEAPEATFSLQLLHASDMDGSTGALSNVENFSAILDSFRRKFPDNTLVVSSGDNYIPGPRYFAAADDDTAAVLGFPGEGRGDIALLNAMGFQASAVGNHELDRGTEPFAKLIAREGATPPIQGPASPISPATWSLGTTKTWRPW